MSALRFYDVGFFKVLGILEYLQDLVAKDLSDRQMSVNATHPEMDKQRWTALRIWQVSHERIQLISTLWHYYLIGLENERNVIALEQP